MAVSILTSSSHVQSLFGTSITQAINSGATGSDRLMIIGLSFDSNGSGGKGDAAQYNSSNMTFIGRILPVNGTNPGVELWYIVAPSTGSNNFTCNFINDTTGNPQEVAGVHIQHWTLQDALQTGQPDVSGTDSGTDAARSVALTTTEGDTILLGIAAGLKGVPFASWAPQGGATEDSDTSTPDFTISTGLHRAQATAAATSLATTMNSANATSVMVAAAFKSVAGTSVDIGQASETDTAQSITTSKAADLGQASETDIAQSIAPSKAVDLGQASETGIAQSITPTKSVPIGQAVETSLAQSITAEKSVPIGQAVETDTGQTITPMAAGPAVPVGQVLETDIANSIIPSKSVPIGQAVETDRANPMTPPEDAESARRGGGAGGRGGRTHSPQAVILPPRSKSRPTTRDRQRREDREIALLISIIGGDT